MREADRQTGTDRNRQTETGRQKQRQQDEQIEKKAHRLVKEKLRILTVTHSNNKTSNAAHFYCYKYGVQNIRIVV